MYRELLFEGSLRFGCAIHAWVFMRNHVHLLLTPEQPTSIAQLTQWMGSRYVRWYNRRHERTGHLWQGRFYSSVIETQRYFLTCCTYIDQNPVRAGICPHPGTFAWSSYARLALGIPDALLTEHDEYRRLGATAALRQHAYRDLCHVLLDRATAERLRKTTHRGEVFGATEFVELVERQIGRTSRRLAHGGARRRPDCRRLQRPRSQRSFKGSDPSKHQEAPVSSRGQTP